MKKEFCDICGKEIERPLRTTHVYFHGNSEKYNIQSADLCTLHGQRVWDYIQSMKEEEK